MSMAIQCDACSAHADPSWNLNKTTYHIREIIQTLNYAMTSATRVDVKFLSKCITRSSALVFGAPHVRFLCAVIVVQYVTLFCWHMSFTVWRKNLARRLLPQTGKLVFKLELESTGKALFNALTFWFVFIHCSTVDVSEEAKKLIGTGNRHLVMGDVVSAVSVLQEACAMLWVV